MEKIATKLPNGEAVREFYSSIKIIEEYYQEKGYRKKAYLYRTLQEKLGWKMSLESFKYHFKKAFETTTSQRTLCNNDITQNNKELTPRREPASINDNDGPIIPQSTASKGFNYNPSTKELDPKKTI